MASEKMDGLPTAIESVAARWWESLSDEIKEELALLWSSRAESCCYARSEGEWKELPILVGAMHFPPEDLLLDGEDWNQDLYEYLINNPELALVQQGVVQHICTAHPEVRRALRQGVIRADFNCGKEGGACLMSSLLALQPGCDVKLFPIWMGNVADPPVATSNGRDGYRVVEAGIGAVLGRLASPSVKQDVALVDREAIDQGKWVEPLA